MVAAHFSTQLGRCRPRTANGGRQFFSSYYAARIRRPFFNTPRPDPAARARSSSGPAVSFQRHVHVMIKVPSMADSISEGTLSTFSKQIGEYIEADEELASIETDKIDVSVNAPHAGVVTKLLVTIGETVTVDQEIAQIDTEAESSSPPSEPPSERDEVRKEVHSEPDTDNPPGSITARSEDSMGTPAREESADNHDSHVSAPPSRPIDPSKEEFGTRQGVREIKSPPLAVPVIEDVQTPAHNVPLRSERLVCKPPSLLTPMHADNVAQVLLIGAVASNAEDDRPTTENVSIHKRISHDHARNRHEQVDGLAEAEQRPGSGSARGPSGLHGGLCPGGHAGSAAIPQHQRCHRR